MKSEKSRTRSRTTGGFTLVEVMIVVCIIGILLCMVLPAFARSRDETTESLCIYNLQRIEHTKAL